MNEPIVSQPDSEETPEIHRKNRWSLPGLNLAGALALVIIMAGVIVAVGYILYWNNPDHKYDIARPGDKDENRTLSVEDDTTDKTSPVDAAAAKQKIDYLSKEAKALSGFSQFSADDLSDQSLQITPSDKPSY